jgi:hypothetical protein
MMPSWRGRMEMEHERVGVRAQLSDDERHLVRHEAADEIDVSG